MLLRAFFSKSHKTNLNQLLFLIKFCWPVLELVLWICRLPERNLPWEQCDKVWQKCNLPFDNSCACKKPFSVWKSCASSYLNALTILSRPQETKKAEEFPHTPDSLNILWFYAIFWVVKGYSDIFRFYFCLVSLERAFFRGMRGFESDCWFHKLCLHLSLWALTELAKERS